MANLKNIRTIAADANVQFGSEVIHFVYRPNGITPSVIREEKRASAEGESELLDFLSTTLSNVLVSWDLQEDDQDIDINKETLDSLSVLLLSELYSTIIRKLG